MQVIGERMKLNGKERWTLLGASSGLGLAFSKWATEQGVLEQQLISRKSQISFDFSKEENWPEIIRYLIDFKPSRLFYFAGGGPYGLYSEKKWNSHLWAYRVNLLFPAFLLSRIQDLTLNQAVFLGSSVAEAQPDPAAASYASAKHGLKGLVTSLQVEKSFPYMDLRLFSPGYMDTPLLPTHAWPRQTAGRVIPAPEVAKKLGNWIQDSAGINGHLILNP